MMEELKHIVLISGSFCLQIYKLLSISCINVLYSFMPNNR